MAVEKYLYLDASGVSQLSTTIFKGVNSRIRERITTDDVAAKDFSDSKHVLSSESILKYLGNLADYAVMTGEEASILGKIKAVETRVSGLTHLTYKVVEGKIEEQVPVDQAKTDVIYLQHDEPSMMIANDGYLMHDANTRATANDGTNDYNAIAEFDSEGNAKFYKVVDGVKGDELAAGDPIFDDVAMVEDKTYNLYIANPTGYKTNANGFLVQADGSTICSYSFGGETYYAYDDNGTWKKSLSSESYEGTDPETVLQVSDPVFAQAGFTGIEWICVGDTALELDNYWSKKDSDVAELRDLIVGDIADADVVAAVEAAWEATDPFDEATADDAYLDDESDGE